MEIAGHIVGAVGIVFFFLSYQIYDKKKLLAVQTIATSIMCLQYLLLGAYSGFALNVVCLIRNFFFYNRGKKFFSGNHWPVLFALAMAAVSLLSWDGWHSLFIIAGLMINTLCLGFCNSQDLRKSILLTCPMIIVYNCFELSIAGIISESISMISAGIGIIRYRKA